MRPKWLWCWLAALSAASVLAEPTQFKFTKSRYNISFYENTITKAYGIPSERMGIPTGNLLFGEAPSIRYKIVRGVKSAENYFKAEARQVGNFCFLLIRTKTGTSDVLNRERTSQYKFSVRATVKSDGEEKEIAETEIVVTILDRNDLNPIFFPPAYEVTVPSDMPLHTSIVQVTAEDADMGINGEIYYSFREDSDIFAIHPLTGIVTLTRALVGETESLYEFTVYASDRGPKEAWQQSVQTIAKASLRIIVVPVNLHDPVITIEPLTSLIEQSHADIYAIVRVTDPDVGVISQTPTLEIVDGDPDGVFRIKKGRNADEFYVEMLKLIDRERTPLGYNLTLRATDGGKPPRSSAELLKVIVADQNDNPPVFEKQVYRVEISEIAPVGTQLLRLKVNDADQGKNAQVVFAIAGGNEYGCFRVNPHTGVLYIANALDAETRSEYTITVSALDQANIGTRKQSSAKVQITVIDANDNDPLFPTTSLDIDIDENEPVGSIVAQVSAKDADKGENGYVSYSIANLSPIPFEIDPFTGVIKTTDVLDYETERRKYVLKVRASDWGTPYKRQTELLLTVSVRDVNDNKPQFLAVNCLGKVSRNTPFGTELVTLSAVDFDEKGTVTYRIISGNEDGCFSLDAITGIISVSCDLTDVGTSERVLNVTANDGQYFSDVTSVKVTLTGSRKRNDLGLHQNVFSCSESPTKKRLNEIQEMRESLPPTVAEIPPLPSRFGQNIHSPEFVDFPAQLRVNESVVPGSQLVKLRGRDRDHGYNGLLVFAISGGDDDSVFNIELETGLLKVAGAFDRERRAGYVLNITVFDLGNPQRSSSKLLPVVVTDINDNAPKFENPIITAAIPESALVGTSVARLFASDSDDGDNAKVTYQLLTDTSDFKLDPLSGLLTVSGSLDREQKGYYELLVTARDMGVTATTPVLSAQALVRVKILDVNDNPPKFASSMQVVKVREDVPKGIVVAIVSATDNDLDLGGRIEYSIAPTYQSDFVDNFAIDSKTGTVRLRKKLDYEERQIYNMTVIAVDSGLPRLSSSCILVIEVVDVNENMHSPKFEELVTNFTVKENEPVNTVVGQVIAVDFDPPGSDDSRITYSIRDGDGLGYFSIDNEGIIRTRCSLDRETTPYFWLTVLATDRGVVPFSASIEVFIEVEDVNDHIPLTDQAIYFANVPEHSPRGTLVLKVSATDEDGPKEKFTYQLKGDPQSFFSIDKYTGDIRTTSRSLDRETQSEHTLEVVVSDNRSPPLSSSTRVVVTVDDINDHAPEFLAQSLYKFVVPSNIKVDEEIGQVLAFDKDSGVNGEIEYSLIETGKAKPRFTVNPISGVISSLRTLQAKQTYAFDVRATDKGTPALSSHIHVIVSTLEIPSQSENSPKVEESINHVLLEEDEPVGTLVTGIYAHDDDGDQLWYSITGGNIGDAFSIDKASGQIHIRKKLDAEEISFYNLTIDVTDGNNHTETFLEISVLDTNDNPPQFTQQVYEASISEGAEVGTEVVVVTATDPDQTSKLFYSAHAASSAITLKKFRVEETGRIVLAEKLDRETMNHHTLIVSVHDNGAPVLRNFARVRIEIRDDNDHAPDFPSQMIHTRIFETAAAGSTVAEVIAIDRDRGDNAKLTYSIASGNSESIFTIDSESGRVSLEKELDGLTRHEYSLKIRATDGGVPPLSSVCTLHITVVIADNVPPRFTRDIYEADILESAPYGTVVISLDILSASSPLYEIIGGNVLNAFDLNPTTGILTVGNDLDYETKRMYNLTVQATNMAGLKSSAIVLVHVRDVNDNAPRFTTLFYEGVISEAAAINAVVYNANVTKSGLKSVGTPLILRAEDDDSGINAQITFEILDNFAKTYFTVDSSTGALKTIAPLDYETFSDFDFTVRVSDNGNPRLISESHARVHIQVQDVNDCPPKFPQQIYNASLFVPTYPGVHVIQLQATDADSVDSQLSYSIVAGNVDSKFAINPKTGVVSVANATLLRPFYQLDITVTDGHYASATLLTITVDALKNDSLAFSQSVYTASVAENSTKVQRVAILQVVGSELNEHVFFHILNPDEMFSIGKTSGVLYTTGKPFDREVKDKYDVFVEARVERGLKIAHASVQVTIEDVNDNKPIFVNQPYRAIVKMGSQKGDVIGKVHAIDYDIKENGEIRYELLRGNGEFFKLGKKTGEIILRQTPHNHNGDYELAIVAYDEGSPGLSAEASVQIKVVDRNSPVFDKPFYYAAIREDTPLYSPLLSVSAFNPTDRKLIYTITSGNDMEEFSLDFETAPGSGNGPCVLTLIAHLNYEERQHYELAVRALDSVSGIFTDVDIAIDVLDVNDNYPEFAQSVYNVTVSEMAPVGSQVVKLKAFDVDSGDNQKVFYQLRRDPDQPEVFRVDENTGVITFIKPLDYETQHLYHLTGIVTDLGIPPLSTSVHIWINVKDENDNPPRFEAKEYSCLLSKEAERGQFLGMVKAWDPDVRDQHKLKYAIIGGDDAQNFAIDENSGIVTFASWSRFPNVSTVVLNVSVTDDVYSATTTFAVHVFSRNSNAPVFQKGVFEATIRENLAPGMFVTKVWAVDADEGDTEQLTFSIMSQKYAELFRLDERTGDVYTQKSLDRESIGQYEIWISARDPGGKSGFALLRIRITDDNDNKPEFVMKEYSANVYANFSVGSAILRVQALDADVGENGRVRYSINGLSAASDIFDVNPENGDVILIAPLTGKENEAFQFFVRAEDSGESPLSTDVPVTILVMGPDDRAPKLEHPTTKYFVLESSPVGCLIARAKLQQSVEDPLQFSIVSTSGYNRPLRNDIESEMDKEDIFAIDEEGKITLLRQVDREKQDTYTLMVKVSTLTSPRLSDVVPIVIQVTDSNDSTPEFDSLIYKTKIPENTPKDTSIFKVSAEDADVGNNREISYYITPNASTDVLSKFKIDSTTGWIVTVDEVDREKQARYVIPIVAVDNGSPRRSSAASMIVELSDVNDNPPVFAQSRYFVSVNEDTDVGTNLLTLSMTDVDLVPQNVVYYITKGDPRSQFAVKENGELEVIRQLDREDISSYSLEVAATDGVFVAWTTVAIDVLDDNDNPPYCAKFRYKDIRVSEGAALGTPVFVVEARDDDEKANSRVRFFLTGDGAEDFAIDSATGQVRVARLLDRESRPQYRLISHIQDRDKPQWECTADVIINIDDVNDNQPQFKVQNVTVNVPEDLEVKNLITKVHASDIDLGNNRTVRYSLLSNSDGHFLINEVSGIITLAKPLDRESLVYHNITVMAADLGNPRLNSTTSVTVVVLDVNDNPPEFESKTYFASIEENATIGTEVTQLLATSLDTGMNAEIIYSILGGNEHRKFAINSKTGSVTIIEALDYERASEYYLTIQAIDRGIPPLSNHATLNITVLDSNDNKPIFNHPSYAATIREDAAIGEAVVKVTSSDLDSGDNGRVSYRILSGDRMGQFVINPDTGVISINSALDREMVAQYTLDIEARDNGYPTLASTVQVVIDVLDANDNPPQFSQPNYTTVAQEDKPLGFIILTLQVSDADTPLNGAPFSFEITHGNDDNSFRLDGDGMLRMARPLNHRLKDTYVLGVRVYDHGVPPLHSDTWVTVKVIEESRYSPIITPLEITINTLGDEFSGGIIGKVHASDQDPYDSLNFSIVRTPIKGAWNLFEIDREDGTLIVKPGLDVGEYSVNVSVTDGKYYSYSTVIVSVVTVSNEALKNGVIVTLRDVTLEDFLLIHRKNFIKTVRNLMQVRTKDVIIISVQVSASRRSQRDTLYEFVNMTAPVWRTRENPKRPNIDVLFAVQKTSMDFYPASVLREMDMTAFENGLKVYVAGIARGSCTPDRCKHGKCEDKVVLTDSVTSVVTERMSFVTPKHNYAPVCICINGYVGENCDTIANECVNNPCATPLICVPTPTSPGYICKCPDGLIGPACGLDVSEQCTDGYSPVEHSPCYVPRSPLSFTGKSYAQYSLASSIDKKLILSLRLRTVQPTGNIMFVAGRVDYSILEMVNGQVQYRFDCGSGEGLVRVSGTYVNDGKWHEIRLQRHGNKAELFVDGRFSAHGSAPGVNDVLNVENTDVYFGAEVRQLPGLPGFDDTRMGFIGCLDDIRVDRALLPYHVSGNYVVAASVPIGAPAQPVVATLRRFTNVEFICRHNLIRPGLCGSQPCMNGGTCIEVGGVTYQCKCHDRFVGAKCEIDTDPCASSPCLFGGVCFNLQNDYRCQCPERLTGKRCEYGRFCKPNPCKNGGICEEGISGPICKCRGFTGELCNTDINECEPNPCHSGGTCLNMFGTFKCSCPPNATGQYCSETVGLVDGVVGWFSEISREIAIGILVAFVALIITVITVCFCYCWRKKKRRSRRRYYDSNGREMMPLNSMRDYDYAKKLAKNSNLDAVASQVPPMLPPRPSSYTPSGNDQNYVTLNNLDTIRSYGSAGDELETLPMLNYGQSDFSNLNNGGQIHEGFGGIDEEELRKQPWPEMEHNLAGKYYEKINNDFKLKGADTSGGMRLNLISNLKPNNKEMTVAYVNANGAGRMSSTEDCAPRSSRAVEVAPPIPPLPRDYAEFQSALEKHLTVRKDYHWDCSDWANTSVNPDIAEIAGGSMVDAASCHSHETSDSNYGNKLFGPPLDENGRLAVREPPIGACDAPLHSPTEQVSFEQIIAKSGLRLSQLGATGGDVAPLSEISDLNESLPSPCDYVIHPNAYLPAHRGVQSETDVELSYADDTEDDDAPSLLSVSIPSQIRLPDERLSLSASYAARESMSDVSNVCDIEETDCEDSGSHRSVMQTAL